MKRFRRTVLLLTLIVSLTCIVLLLNFTAPNPTSRRYSSESVIVSGTPSVDGPSGEHVLAIDLGQPNNNDSGQKQCLCEPDISLPTSRCNSCLNQTIIPIASNRLPDFVTDDFIADSKNAGSQSYDEQLQDFVAGAIAIEKPLWLFTRTDTLVTRPLLDAVRSTGGDVVMYFVAEGSGFIDPTDQAASLILIASGLVMIVLVLPEIRVRPVIRPPSRPADPVDTATDFLDKTKDKTQRDIDKSSSRIEIDS